MTSSDEALNNIESILEQDQERLVRNALGTIEKAEAELRHIRTQLIEASAGRAYYRIDSVEGPNVGTIFAAFTTIESLAQLRYQKEAN